MISEDRLAKQTKAAANGRSDGRDNLPPPDATSYSTTENDIVALVQKELDDKQTAFRNDLNAEIHKAPETGKITTNPFRGVTTDANNKLVGIMQSHKDQLLNAQVDEKRAWRHLNYFKASNELEREPDYSGSFLLTAGILATCILAETTLNAWLFGEASDRGIFGGAVTAALISTANVVFSFAAGWWPLRYLGHRKHWHKIWAMPVLIVMFIAIVTFNFLVGHYRELLIINPDAQLIRVVDALLGGFFDIQQLPSWVLVLFGFVISGLAIHKGYLWNDKYPGFAAADKRHRINRDHHHALREGIITQLSEQGTGIEKQVNGNLAAEKDLHSTFSKSVNALAQRTVSLESEASTLEEICNRVLEIYRAENKAIRTEPAPAYFSEPHELRRTTDWAEIKSLKSIVSEASKRLEQLDNYAHQSKEEISSRIEQLIDSLQEVNEDADAKAEQILDEKA